MKLSIVLFVVFGCLLAPGSGSLLAQRGQGKMGGSGLGVARPPMTGRSTASRRETGKSPGGASAATMRPERISVNARLANNTALSARIQPLLPAGATVATASAGFRNRGQFIAALHVSRNLNIPFDQLKGKMTGQDPVSLGKAIHDLRPDLSRSAVKRDVRVAERQADHDIDTAWLANRLSNNATLAARARVLLPAGTNLQAAAAGFKDARQFLLVEHVARDLNIPFAQLKARVTGSNPESLQQSIGVLRPDLSKAAIRADLKVARQETKADLMASESAESAAEQKMAQR